MGTRPKKFCIRGHELDKWGRRQVNAEGIEHRTCKLCRSERDRLRYNKNPQKFRTAQNRRNWLKRRSLLCSDQL